MSKKDRKSAKNTDCILEINVSADITIDVEWLSESGSVLNIQNSLTNNANNAIYTESDMFFNKLFDTTNMSQETDLAKDLYHGNENNENTMSDCTQVTGKTFDTF